MNISADIKTNSRRVEKLDPNENFEMQTAMIQPWSSPVMKSWLPERLVHLMLELSDDLKGDEEYIDWGSKLVGQVHQETLVPLDRLAETGVKGFFENLVRTYVVQCLAQKNPTEVDKVAELEIATKIQQMWVVSQYENDYNPLHQHPNCDVAAVMYLKVPEMLPSRKDHRRDDDGCITFVGSGGTFDDLSFPLIQLAPQVGDIYFFNSKILHTVNPFRCPEWSEDQERRSVSFNSEFQILNDATVNLGK